MRIEPGTGQFLGVRMLAKTEVGGEEMVYGGVQTDEHEDNLYNASISQLVPDVTGSSHLVLCAGCGTRIVDRYFLLVAEQHWHVPCLRCVDCHVQLDTQLTCFARDGNIYCKEDYYRRHSMRRCSRCHVGLSSHELVMRARDLVFHVDCFTCAACNRHLATGDTYGIHGDEVHGDQVFCQEDYEILVNNGYHDNDDSFVHAQQQGPQLLFRPQGMLELYSGSGFGALQKGRPRKRRHGFNPADGCLTLGMITNERGDIIPRDNFVGGHAPRQKRVRTSFKHHQLRTMKSYFALNHNPDAKDLKQLSQKTQLSKRVLQVWFQNARAKYRRSQSKQPDDNSTTGAKPSAGSDNSEQLLDLSKCPSPSLSDVSSGDHSVPDSLDINDNLNSGDDFTELFSDGNASS